MTAKLGTQTHSERLASGLFGAVLYRMALKLPPTERIKPKEKKPNGSKARAQAILPDAELAAWRYEYEHGLGGSMKQMANRYGVTYDRMNMLLSYCVRADVNPAPRQPAQCGVVRGDERAVVHEQDSPFFCANGRDMTAHKSCGEMRDAV